MFIETNSCCMIILIRSFRAVSDIIAINMNIILLFSTTSCYKRYVMYMLFPSFVSHSGVNSSIAFIFHQQYTMQYRCWQIVATHEQHERMISCFNFSHVLFFIYLRSLSSRLSRNKIVRFVFVVNQKVLNLLELVSINPTSWLFLSAIWKLISLLVYWLLKLPGYK